MTYRGSRPKHQRLYKYRSLEEGTTRDRTLAILKNCELRYSAVSKFNDPFDCHLDIAVMSTPEIEKMAGKAIDHGIEVVGRIVSNFFRKLMEGSSVTLPGGDESVPKDAPTPSKRWTFKIRRQDEDGQWRAHNLGRLYNEVQSKRMSELYEILDKSFGVLCLSERPDDILLWSHYGDSHRGVCLEFDVAAHPDAFPRLHAVKYHAQYPRIPSNFPDILALFHDKSGGEMKDTVLNMANMFAHGLAENVNGESPERVAAGSLARWFYVKSTKWKYEREWRCLKTKPGPESFPPSALTRIIVGCTDSEATLALVRQAIADSPVKDVPLYKAVRKARKFGLDIVPAD